MLCGQALGAGENKRAVRERAALRSTADGASAAELDSLLSLHAEHEGQDAVPGLRLIPINVGPCALGEHLGPAHLQGDWIKLSAAPSEFVRSARSAPEHSEIRCTPRHAARSRALEATLHHSSRSWYSILFRTEFVRAQMDWCHQTCHHTRFAISTRTRTQRPALHSTRATVLHPLSALGSLLGA